MSGRYGSDDSGTPSRGGGYGRSGGSGSGGYGGNSQSRGGGYQAGGGGGVYQSGDRGNRGGGGGGRGGGRGGGSGREGDWVCPSPSCGNVNFARRTECNKCGTPSPGGSNGGSGIGGYNRGGGGDGAYNRGSGGGNRGGRSDYGGRGDYDRRGTNEGYSQVPPPASGNNYPPPPSYGGMSSYGADLVTTQNGSNSYPPSYGAPPNPYGPGQGGGGPPSNYNSDHQGGGYGAPAEAAPVKVKQCDENCGDTCDNSRIYISNLPSDVTIEELQELFGGIGMVGRIKQKRGYKDQWPWNIKIYTDDNGKKKGDACLAYEDPSAAHSAGGFYNGYDLRGNIISVSMAEKSAPKPQTSFGHGGGGGRGGYSGGDRRRDNYRDNSGPQRSSYGGQRSRPY